MTVLLSGHVSLLLSQRTKALFERVKTESEAEEMLKTSDAMMTYALELMPQISSNTKLH